jgi:hypothetical protein
MKKYTMLTILVLTLTSILALSVPTVLAGTRNQNANPDSLAYDAGNSIERGTGRINGGEGCRPDVQSGNYTVDMAFGAEELAAINGLLAGLTPPLYLTTDEWVGGPCCPSNQIDGASGLPLPNQCCNPPDMGPPGTGVPGNHCECFELRGYPFPYAVDLL